MKLKRFVAIVISLSMVLSIVPAFSLTASAAGTTGVIDALGGEVLWACPDGSFNDTAIGTAFSGWSSSITSGYVNVKTYSGVGNVIQYYVNGTAMVSTITSPGYGDGTEEKLIIEWVMKRQNPNDLYFDFSFTDKSGTEIAFIKLDKNYTSVTGEYYMGYPAEGTDCAIVATNNGDGTHKVEYYVAGSVVSTIDSKEGTVNGFGGITSSNGRWSTAWNHIGFGNLTIGAVYPAAETEVEVTVEYTADGEVVKTVNGRYDTAEGETGLALEAFTYAPNGGNYIYTADATTMSESGTIAMTKLDNWNGLAIGDTVTYGGKNYEVTGTNLIPNGDFSQGTTGWYNGAGSAATFFTSNGDGTMTTTSGGGGQATTGALYRAWKIEPGKTYVYTYTSSGGGTYHKNSLGASFNATAGDGSNVILEGAAGTNTIVFTAGESENYLIVSYRWLGTSDTFGNYGIYEVAEKIETTDTTVKASLDAISLPLATKTSITVPTTATDAYDYVSTVTWTSSNADVLAADGTVTSPSDITEVALTPSTTYNGTTITGDAHTVTVFPASVAGTEYNSGSGYYDIGTENIILTNGTNASFEDASGNQSLTGWLAHTGVETNSAMNWVDATVDVVPDGNWAYAGWWNDPITGTNYCTIDTMWPVEAGTYYLSFYAKKPAGGSTTYVYFSEDNAHHTAVDQLTSEAWYELVSPTSEWAKYQYIITAETAGYIGFTSYNIGNNGSRGTMFDDFELYTATQAAEDLVSITTPETITVIAGNEPVLPATVTGVGERGSNMEVAVVWNAADFSAAGDVTVTGTAGGMDVSMTVTVLPMTFSMEDANSNVTVNFPADVTGDFYLEFDMNATNLDNLWIYASKDGAVWGSGQIGLGWDNAGNGYFRAMPADQTNVVFATNRTYRFLVHGNVTDSNYDLVVYDTVTKEAIFTCTDYAFRTTGVSCINSIAFTSNGEGGVGTLSNIKVYAPDQADLFTSYTYVVTGAGSNDGTFTTTATSAEGVKIPYFEGYILADRSVSGTTVTYTYEAQTDSLGSWAIRNNVTDNTWLTEMKYLGAHNAFANTDTLFENEGGSLYGTYGAGTTTDAAKNISRTQSLSALDQLNAGVRYFDIRLSRQSDGSFVTVHGPAFNYFRPIAYTIAQWAAENPGEVILLDFQTMVDAMYTEDVVVTGDTSYYGESAGDDNKYAYDALVALLEEAGIMDYVYYTGTGWDAKYGALTNNGTRTAIVLIGKGRLANCDNRFANRSTYTSNETTYVESDSFSTVVSNIDSTYTSISSGAHFGYIHAYTTTALSFSTLLGSSNILNDAATNNPNWASQTNFAAWFGRGIGDVLMMNGITEEIGLQYLAYLDEWNRDGTNSLYGNEHETSDGMTVNGVTVTGATSSIPFSTELTVAVTNNEVTTTVDDVEYTTKAAYDIDLMLYDTESTALTGDVTIAFPKASADDTTVDVLFFNDEVVYTAGVGEAISYTTSTLGTYVVATMAAPSVEYTVNYAIDGTVVYTDGPRQFLIGQDAYNFAASTTGAYVTFGGKAYIVTNEAQSKTITADDVNGSATVNFTLVHDNAVLYDTFGNNDGSNDCNNTANMLFIGSAGVSDPGDADADASAMANAGGNVGSPRIPVLTFNVPEVADGKAVKLNLYVAKANQNLNNGSMKLAVGTADLVVDETLGYKAADIANTTDIIWSDQMFTAVGDATDGRREVNSWVTVDVTEFVKAATDTITFTLYAPTAGAYVADREKAVAGGAYEGMAAYLEVVDAYTVEVTGASKITRNGNLVDSTTAVTAYEGAQIKLYETSSETPAFTNGTKVYATDNTTGETPYITVTGDDEYYAATVGVAPVNGAQVRIGYGVDRDGKVGSESGLRFITTVDYNQSLATVTGATFGVEITAEGSSAAPVVIPADLWQDDAKTVFTTALTNLAESNFNRKFTATPYVTVDGQTFYGTSVTRSIYQVAAGLLVNTSTDGTEYDQSALDSTVLYKVLNAYVNQTGIRLSVTSEGLTAYTGTGTSAYSGDQFFEVVSSETVSENVYAITIKPAGDKTTINSYWQEYIRINNNNSAIKDYTSMVDNGDGTVTITFDYASYLAAQAQ